MVLLFFYNDTIGSHYQYVGTSINGSWFCLYYSPVGGGSH